MTPINNEDGLSEVIGIILIIALIMIFLSIWVIYAVPAEGRQQEISHMDYIQDWFTQYKITADSLWINYDAGERFSTSDIPVSNSIMLGSQGGATNSGGLFLALMKPFGSSGTISLNEDGERLEIRNSTGVVLNENIASIRYEAGNNYWIQQTYYYQMGGVFLKQNEGTVNRVAPLISFSSDGGVNSAVIVIIRINNELLETAAINGQGPVRIDTAFKGRSNVRSLTSGDLTLGITLMDESAARAWRSILKERGGNVNPLSGSEVTITGLDEIHYQYADYTVSLQSVAAGFS